MNQEDDTIESWAKTLQQDPILTKEEWEQYDSNSRLMNILENFHREKDRREERMGLEKALLILNGQGTEIADELKERTDSIRTRKVKVNEQT